MSYSWKGTFIISAQNVFHEFQCTPQHVSLWTVASIQRCWGTCRYSDTHPQCDSEVPLCCQQELHTQGLLGVPTGKNPENSNQVSMEAMQWACLYLSISHNRTSHTAWLKWIGHDSILSVIIHKLNVSRWLLIWTFFLVFGT